MHHPRIGTSFTELHFWILAHRSLYRTPLNELSEKAYVKFDGVMTCEDAYTQLTKLVWEVSVMELVFGSARAGARCNVDGGCHCFGLFSFQRVGE